MKLIALLLTIVSTQAFAAEGTPIPAENSLCLEQAANQLVSFLNSEDKTFEYHIVRSADGLATSLKDIVGDGSVFSLGSAYQTQSTEEVVYFSETSDEVIYAVYETKAGKCDLLDIGMGQNDGD